MFYTCFSEIAALSSKLVTSAFHDFTDSVHMLPFLLRVTTVKAEFISLLFFLSVRQKL